MMRSVIFASSTLLGTFLLMPMAQAQTLFTLNGAGSYLGQPLIRAWGDTYGDAILPVTNPPGPVVPGLTVSYGAVGSQSGKNAFINTGLVPGSTSELHFAATSIPLTSSELQTYQTNQASRGAPIQVPLAGEALVFAYNPEGMNLPNGPLKLSRATYCAIADGVILNWDNKAITRDNNGIKVRTGPITFVRRADTSGETLHLSNHLQTVCTGQANFPAPYNATPYPSDLLWARGAGAKSETVGQTDNLSNTVDWPDSFMTASGGDRQVIQKVQTQVGAIGYVAAAYTLLSSAQTSGLPAARLQNQSNLSAIAANSGTPAQFYTGNAQGTSNALSGLGLSTPFVGYPNVREFPLTSYSNPLQAVAYPVVSPLYALFYELYDTQTEVDQCGCTVQWALQNPYPDPLFTNGDNPNPEPIARNRTYAPLPANLKTEVLSIITAIQLSGQLAFRSQPRFWLASAEPFPLLGSGRGGKCRDL